MLVMVKAWSAPGHDNLGLNGVGSPSARVDSQNFVPSTSARPSSPRQCDVRVSPASRTATRYWWVVQWSAAAAHISGCSCDGTSPGVPASVAASASTSIDSKRDRKTVVKGKSLSAGYKLGGRGSNKK